MRLKNGQWWRLPGRPPALMALGFAVTVVLVGCGVHTIIIRQHPTPTATKTPVATPTPVALAACPVTAITASLGQSNGAAGRQGYAILLTNTGTTSCTLEGYPYVQLVDGSGNALSTTPIESDDGVTSVSVLPDTVTLGAGGTASFALQYDLVPRGSQTCPTAASMRIYLPGTSDTATPAPVTFSAEIAPCGGIVYLSPIHAGTSSP
ncbi:MAG: DUF4232 domain-containing protein [Candidatus Dormiibacterota bacterium]